MASHPEQLRYQIFDALDSALCLIDELDEITIPSNLDISLAELLPGKTSSHFIAIFSYNADSAVSQTEVYKMLNNARDAMMDEVAAAITRKRVPNITFKVAGSLPKDLL
jgi:ribosome-binding factor A